MSVEATRWVWERSQAIGTAKFVQAAIADHADKNGYAWPSVGTLAKEVTKSERTVQRALRMLVAINELEITLHGRPDSSASWIYRPNLYRVPVLRTTKGFERESDRPVVTPASGLDLSVATPASGSGDAGDSLEVTPMAPEPPREPPKNPSAASPSVSPPTERDELFATVSSVCAVESRELTSSGRGAVNRAVGELVAVGAKPENVRERAKAYRRLWPNAKLTPNALVTHWAQLATTNGNSASSRSSAPVEDFPPVCEDHAERVADLKALLHRPGS